MLPNAFLRPFPDGPVARRVVPQDSLMLDISRIPQTFIAILLPPLVVLA
jgi:hypothetical protein